MINIVSCQQLFCATSTILTEKTARKLGSVCVGFGPTGIFQLCDQLENIGWTSSVMSLKKILAKIFAKNIGRVSSATSFKLTGNDCVRYDQAMAVHFQCNCWRLIHLWKWFGLEGGGVVLCKRIGCSLPQSIFSLNLVFGVANRGFQLFWNNKNYLLASFFLQQEPLVLQPCG